MLNIFCVFICHLNTFFCEVPLQVFGPFFKLRCLVFLILSFESFLYTWITVFCWILIYKYFSLSVAFLLIFLTIAFEIEVLQFDQIKLIIFLCVSNSLIFSSAVSNLLLIPSSLFFASRNPMLAFVILFHLPACSCFPVFLSIIDIFILAILVISFLVPPSLLYLASFLLVTFPLVMDHIFCLLACLSFLLDARHFEFYFVACYAF